MSEVNPSSSSPALTSKTTRVQLKSVIKNPPASFTKQLVIGTRFGATLNTSVQGGHCEIVTHLGKVKLQTSLPLPINSRLELKLLSKGNQPQVLITTINGLAPSKALHSLGVLPVVSKNVNLKTNNTNKANASPKQPTTFITTNIQKITNTNISASSELSEAQKSIIGSNVIATLLKSKANNIENRSTRSILSRTIKKLTLQGPSKTFLKVSEPSLRSSISNISQKISGNRETLSQTKEQQITKTEQKLQSDESQITVRIKSIKLPTSTRNMTPRQSGSYLLATGTILNGAITGEHMPSGHQIVNTQIGSLAISLNSSLPTGSQLTLEILYLENDISNTTKEAQTNQMAGSQSLIQQWPSLNDAIHTLNQSNPTAAQQLIQAVIPHPGPTLGGNIIFFVMALSNGNLSNWLGDFPTRALRLSKPELFARLKKDFNEIDQFSKQSSFKEWRTTMIPFHDGAQINPLRLSINSNQNEKSKNEQDSEGGTNFIIDLELKVTGRFQIDGLVYRDRNRLDLIVRTKTQLSSEIQNGIRRIFQESTDLIGLMGGVVFQSSPVDFVETSGCIPNHELVGTLI